ncbi:MAG: 1-acyl-sn-glycerol-3-phosphate acyltransferase, partial [Muribaculaceae bacterium]|nr:1-acyl-sn-glycerol-3-phosphate acyltransferase [Muribaculaceae bacterium]
MEESTTPIKRTVLDFDDISRMVPKLKNHEKLVKAVMHWLKIDKVNAVHEHNCDTPGVPFVQGLLKDFNINMRIDGQEVLDSLPEGAFITVSNHPFGALDGIMLIDLIGSRRPDFKVMVNMVLNYIGGMRPNFIAVDAYASSDPKKKAVSMQGIKHAIMQVRQGHPIGFFPAGAVSKIRPN